MAARDKIFVSYSHKDWKLFDEFKTMLAPVIQAGLVDLWDDRKIQTGAKWKDEIERALASARIAVLLVSQNFLASHFIAAKELPPLLKAAEEEGLTIFWIYLSSCLFEQTEIGSYQAAHDISRPLDRLSKSRRQAVLSEVCAKLLRTAQTQELTTGVSKTGTRPDHQIAPRNILIVEDEKELGLMFQMILERAGYRVDLACDGESGLEKLRKAPPDLLVLDWGLPGLSGLDVLKEVRRDPALDGLRILFLSGYADTTERVVALELGADDFLGKPANSHEFVAHVRGLLRRSVKHATP